VHGASRITELDSVRGLAALAVLFGHLAMVYQLGDVETRLVNNAGRAAVIVFFVLSGLVLSLPFYQRNVNKRVFVLRRIFRIYPAYLVAVLAALGMSTTLSRRGIPGLGLWFNRQWAASPSTESLISHVSLVWSFPEHQNELDGPIWSLVYEMRISLIFPWLMALVLWLGWRRTILLAPLVSIVGIQAGRFTNRFWANDWFGTIKYLPMFLVGIVIARHMAAVIGWFGSLPRIARLLWLPGLAAVWALPVFFTAHAAIVRDWADCLAAAMLIVLVLASTSIQGFVRSNLLVFLGRASYSLYLFHLIVILALVNVLYGHVFTPLVLLLALVVSMVVAWAAHNWIEVPGMRLGRFVTGSLGTSEGGVTSSGAEATPP
jgi:peptidoglycan/LPS O-acetylase OafA/YrhL